MFCFFLLFFLSSLSLLFFKEVLHSKKLEDRCLHCTLAVYADYVGAFNVENPHITYTWSVYTAFYYCVSNEEIGRRVEVNLNLCRLHWPIGVKRSFSKLTWVEVISADVQRHQFSGFYRPYVHSLGRNYSPSGPVADPK